MTSVDTRPTTVDADVAPGERLARRGQARIWHKLAVIGLAFTVPLTGATYLLLDQNPPLVESTEHELRGLEYLRQLGTLLPDLVSHRTLARQVIAGDRPAGELRPLQASIDTHYAALIQLDARLGAALRTSRPELGADAVPAAQVRGWQTCKDGRQDKAGSDAAHSALIGSLRTLIGHVGLTSGLLPAPGTHRLAEAMVGRAPELVDRIGLLGDQVDDLLARERISVPERTEIAGAVAVLGLHADGLRDDLSAPAMRDALEPRLRDAYLAITDLVTLTTRGVVNSATVHLDRSAYARAVDHAATSVTSLWTAMAEQEDRLAQLDRPGDPGDRTAALLAVIVGFVLTLLLTIWLSRRISADLAAVAGRATTLAGGDLAARVRVRSRDEIGVMATALNGMAQQLQETIEHQRHSAQQLRAEHDFVDAILNVAGSLMVVCDRTGRIVRFNRTCELTTGYTIEEVTDRPFWEVFLPAEKHVAAEAFFDRLSSSHVPETFEHTWARRDGGELCVAWSTAALVDERGEATHIIATGIDVTARRAAERDLREAQERFRQAFDHASIGMCLVGNGGRFIQVNKALCEMLGRSESELMAMTVGDISHPDDYATGGAAIAAMKAGSSEPFHGVKRYFHADGHIVWVQSTMSAIRPENGAPLYLVAQFEDITERRAAEARLVHLALHDSLTGLPNRALLMDRLRQVLARSARHPELTAVLFIDLDGFKDINDGLGHDIGDHVLNMVAQRIRQHVRPVDTVARLGGDEFVVLCSDLGSEQAAVEISERITSAVARSVTVGGFDVEVTASVGIALSDGEALTPEDMLRNADAAMYGAKTQGKNRWEIFDETRRARAVDRVAIASTLRQALRDNRFVLHFQPVIELDSGVPVAVECLVRLDHPGRGLLPPGAFIQVAEDSGLIVPIGTYVLEEACRQLAGWRADGLVSPDLQTAVNLSARQATQPDLAKTVARALSDAGLEPTALTLELTETVLMDADTSTLRQLEELREMGVGLGIDDFGTGYSSLSYLKRLPVSIIKVDRSFVAGLVTDPSDSEIVTAVLRLGQALGLTTIAEGVEDVAQLTQLRELGCDQAQGYLFGRPQPNPPPNGTLTPIPLPTT